MDLFSKYVVGWALSPSNDRFVTMRALDNGDPPALPGRRPPALLGPGFDVRERLMLQVMPVLGEDLLVPVCREPGA